MWPKDKNGVGTLSVTMLIDLCESYTIEPLLTGYDGEMHEWDSDDAREKAYNDNRNAILAIIGQGEMVSGTDISIPWGCRCDAFWEYEHPDYEGRVTGHASQRGEQFDYLKEHNLLMPGEEAKYLSELRGSELARRSALKADEDDNDNGTT